MYVCVYVWMCVWILFAIMYVCMCVYVYWYACLHVCIHVCVCGCVYVCMYVCVCMCEHVCMWVFVRMPANGGYTAGESNCHLFSDTEACTSVAHSGCINKMGFEVVRGSMYTYPNYVINVCGHGTFVCVRYVGMYVCLNGYSRLFMCMYVMR